MALGAQLPPCSTHNLVVGRLVITTKVKTSCNKKNSKNTNNKNNKNLIAKQVASLSLPDVGMFTQHTRLYLYTCA